MKGRDIGIPMNASAMEAPPREPMKTRLVAKGGALVVAGLLAGLAVGYYVGLASQPSPPPGNLLVVEGSRVHLSVLSGPGTDFTFILGGLTNPTIEVEAGANVTVYLLNIATIPHSWVLLGEDPPYAAHPPEEVAFPGAATPEFDVGTPSGSNATISFTASTSGTFWYVCHVPGHAAGGMFGKFVIRP